MQNERYRSLNFFCLQVITIHGLNGQGSTYHETSNVLHTFRCSVLRYDLYGHGLSTNVPFDVITRRNYTPSMFVQQLEELLLHVGWVKEKSVTTPPAMNQANQQLDRKQKQADSGFCRRGQDDSRQLEAGPLPLAIIAFSMGAVVAASFIQRHPFVHRLVLISPAGMIKNKPFLARAIHCCRPCVPCSSLCFCRCCLNEKRFRSRFSQETDQETVTLLYKRLHYLLYVKGGTIPAFIVRLHKTNIAHSQPQSEF